MWFGICFWNDKLFYRSTLNLFSLLVRSHSGHPAEAPVFTSPVEECQALHTDTCLLHVHYLLHKISQANCPCLSCLCSLTLLAHVDKVDHWGLQISDSWQMVIIHINLFPNKSLHVVVDAFLFSMDGLLSMISYRAKTVCSFITMFFCPGSSPYHQNW